MPSHRCTMLAAAGAVARIPATGGSTRTFTAADAPVPTSAPSTAGVLDPGSPSRG